MPYGLEMTQWNPGTVLVLGVALIIAWGVFGRND